MVAAAKDSLRWLSMLLALVVLAILLIFIGVMATTSNRPPMVEVALAILINLASALIAALVIYTIFTRKGIALPTAENVATEVKEMALSEISQNSPASGVSAFYPSFRMVEWDALLESSSRIDIAVYYFDSWVKVNWDQLVAFFARGGTVNLYLPSPQSEPIVRTVAALFPEYSVDTIAEKIANTGKRLEQARLSSQSQSAALNVFYLDRPAQYSAIMLDGQAVLLSVYENYRVSKIDSSAILLDLTADADLKKYWDKEFGGMQANGVRAEK